MVCGTASTGCRKTGRAEPAGTNVTTAVVGVMTSRTVHLLFCSEPNAWRCETILVPVAPDDDIHESTDAFFDVIQCSPGLVLLDHGDQGGDLLTLIGMPC